MCVNTKLNILNENTQKKIVCLTTEIINRNERYLSDIQNRYPSNEIESRIFIFSYIIFHI